jgi:manganese/zinc/iron transport system substrate-binding protein
MGPGVDPHLFSASEGMLPGSSRQILIFTTACCLEAQLASVLQRLGERKPTVAVAEQLDLYLLLDAGQWKANSPTSLVPPDALAAGGRGDC